MFSRRTISTLLLSTLVALPIAAQALPRFSVTAVAGPGSVATDINNSGTVVGNFPYSATSIHAFTNAGADSTTLLDLGTLGGAESFASGINDAGDVVGTSHIADGSRHAFRWTLATTMIDLGTLGGPNSSAAAINNRGDIVGTAEIGPNPPFESRAFLLRPGVSMQDLGRFEVPNPEGSSHGMGLNNRRQVVGGSVLGPYVPPESAYHAFLYACEEMKDLGTLGGQYSLAYAINARGQVVGEASTLSFRNNRAFLYYRGVMKSLGTLPGSEFSSARDINIDGRVVGFATSFLSDPARQDAFLYESGRMRSLNNLIDPASGWMIRSADGINDIGQIAGTGCRGGQCFAVRLDPL